MDPRVRDTRSEAYARHLVRRDVAWKRWLHLQGLFRWNLRRLGLGFTLDVGCGDGRSLAHLDGRGIGVDHNPRLVAAARARGFEAFEVDEFWRSSHASRPVFDGLLFSHVLEHLVADEASALVGRYLPLLRDGGRVVLVTPQEAGQRADPSHRAFFDLAQLTAILRARGLSLERGYSFPFARPIGRVFAYNESVAVGRKA